MTDKKKKTAGEKMEEYTDSEEFGFKDLFGGKKKKKDDKKKDDKKSYQTLSEMLSGKYK